MKTTVRSKGRRYISGEGWLLLRQGKLNSHRERTDPNRWRDRSRYKSAGPAEPTLVKHRVPNQATVTQEEIRGAKGLFSTEMLLEKTSSGIEIWNRCSTVLSQHRFKPQPWRESPLGALDCGWRRAFHLWMETLSHSSLWSCYNPLFFHLLASSWSIKQLFLGGGLPSACVGKGSRSDHTIISKMVRLG